MANLYDYLEAGFRVFGLHGVDEKGHCNCGNEDCEALFKHPVISNWQSVPDWSDDQIETFEQLGHFKTGFGVLCSGHLIIDVDARNGGVDSFAKLVRDIPEAGTAEFVVNTGSGNGSQHHYFKLSEPTAMVQNHPSYPGLDFKTSGYIVGCSSMHQSGMQYEAERGNPCDLIEAPERLVALLKKPDQYRVKLNGSDVDVSDSRLEEIVNAIPNNGRDYERFIRVGMGIHHTSGGMREDLWHQWAEQADCYNPSSMEKKWHSFGKGSSLATFGTLMHYAQEAGYCEDVTFNYEDGFTSETTDALDTTGIDLKRPPGFVGELTEWVNSQCLYPRENLAVAAALSAVSGLCGMRFVDELDDMSANLIAFCVAGSGTGKEAVQQAYLKIMRAAGVQAAVHGGFKSEQEVMRNLIRHQAAFYSVDELGLVLRKLENASKRGGASYLEGIIGLIMSVYSKANGYLPITGDLKEEIRELLRKDLSRVEKRIEDLPQDSSADISRGKLEKQSQRLQDALSKIDDGLDSPYLTILGYTTPVTFSDLMGFEQATNGFLARAMIFDDLETNPKRKRGFTKHRMSESLQNQIRNLYAPGRFDILEPDGRIEFDGDKTVLPTTQGGIDLLDAVYERFHLLADQHKDKTGLEAIPRRGYELAAKVSLVLALPEGVRSAEHVLWAYALAMADVERKIKLAYSSDKSEEVDGLVAKVLSLISNDHGETEGVICNRLRGTPKEQVKTLLAKMVERGLVRTEEAIHNKNKTSVLRYYAN